MHAIEDIFVVGTDTGVGKSMVSLLLMQLLFAKGCTPFYIKPFQTGCSDAHAADSDAGFIYNHTPALKGRDPEESVIYCYPEPRAPYYAARRAGDCIEPEAVRKVVEARRRRYSPLVIEGAGGLLVPVTENLLMVDIARETACRPLLVARAGLGTINHTLLSIEALRRRRLEPMAVVFVDAAQPPTNGDLAAENMEAVGLFGGVKVAGIIGRISDCSHPPAAACEILESILVPSAG